MAIPDAQKTHLEVVVAGLMTAGGSQSVQTINVFNYRRTTLTGVPSKADFEGVFQTNIIVPMAALLNVRWTHNLTRVRWLNDVEDPYIDFVHNDAGGIVGDSFPSDKAAYLLLRSGVRGRRFKGNKHLGPMSESDTTLLGDTWNAGCMTRLNNFAAAIIGGFAVSGQNYFPCIVSRSNSQLRTNPTALSSVDITQILVNKRIGNMRRRQTASQY